MKLTNQGIKTALYGLNNLSVELSESGEVVPRKLPVKMTFAVRKNRRVLSAHLEDYDEERKDLLKKYCKTDKAGELVTEGENKEAQFKTEKDKKAFGKDHLDLLSTKVDVKIHNVLESTVEGMREVEEHVLAGIEFMIEGWGEEDELSEGTNGEETTAEAETERA